VYAPSFPKVNDGAAVDPERHRARREQPAHALLRGRHLPREHGERLAQETREVALRY
jgi:hypothetical protein